MSGKRTQPRAISRCGSTLTMERTGARAASKDSSIKDDDTASSTIENWDCAAALKRRRRSR